LPVQEDTSILIDTTKQYNIASLKLYTKCAWTPFAAKKGRGKIKQVTFRGKTVFKNGEFEGRPQGQIILPNLS
ncbi:MAG: hypothetical protein WD988_00880, partial [Candidatus Curtissbacteria bacterium]